MGPAFYAIPAPKVQMLPQDGSPHEGLTRLGVTELCRGTLRVSIDGLAELLRTDPQYQCKIQLLRYMPKRRKHKRGVGYIVQPQGFYHPSPWDGSAGTNGSGGVGGGSTNSTSTPRPTDWPVVGLPFGGYIDLRIGDVLLPYFDERKFTDFNGIAITSLCYAIGQTKRKKPSGVKSYAPNPPRGVFRFRFAVWDVQSSRWTYGPQSERVFAFAAKWPARPNSTGPRDYPHLSLVNAEQATSRILVASVGGIVR